LSSERPARRRLGLALDTTPRHDSSALAELRRTGEPPHAATSFEQGGSRTSVGQRHLFAIHLLTASGAALAILAVLAIADADWRAAFFWLGVATLVDGIDGPLARRHRVRERLPQWDGAALDFVVDYVSYVFAPAIIVGRAFDMPPVLAAAAAVVVGVSGALYFADTRMKQPDNSFRGFPAVWNMPIFVLYAFEPPPAVTVVSVVLLAVLTFVPVNFVHPLRVIRWRRSTLAVVGVWVVCALWLLAADFAAPSAVKYVLLAASTYLFCVAAVQQSLRTA
jgi:phosphatidylcholine synthase